MKKFLILHPVFQWGGSENVLLATIKSLGKFTSITLVSTSSILKISKPIYERYGINLNDYEIKEIIGGTLFKRYPLVASYVLQNKIRAIEYNYSCIISNCGQISIKSDYLAFINYPPKLSGIPKKRFRGIIRKIIKNIVLPPIPNSHHIHFIFNSRWTKNNFRSRKVADVGGTVIYPPVTLENENLLKKNNNNLILVISRISPEKKIESALSIFKKLKKNNKDLRLCIIGSTCNSHKKYHDFIVDCVNNINNAQLITNASNKILKEYLKKSSIGLHCMPAEHFGISIVEMLNYGLLTFVPNDGGQVEIVNDTRFIYEDETDAICKIQNILNIPTSELKNIRYECHQKSFRFSDLAFQKNFQDLIGELQK